MVAPMLRRPCWLAALVLALWAPGMRAQPQPLQTIEHLDVSRYMGVWYEVAKFPNWFQRKCVSDTRAEYSVQSPGHLRVLNRCRLADGQFDEALGEARQLRLAPLAPLVLGRAEWKGSLASTNLDLRPSSPT